MENATNLLNNVYRQDRFFLKLKEVWNKWRNHQDATKHIVDSPRDITLLKLKVNYSKVPNILLKQLFEVNFSCKECLKIFLLIYTRTLSKNNMCFRCRKQYLTKSLNIYRTSLDRGLNELVDKNMIIIEKEDGYFKFTINLCFESWNLPDNELINISRNIEEEIEWYQGKYIDENDFL